MYINYLKRNFNFYLLCFVPRKGSVVALVEIHFFNILYSGVLDLQDEIFLQNKLGELDIIGLNMKSIDGKMI
jgi:hypothetical protein